ncbi:hypothetical protein [Natrinema sp. DC36]|uniref:hypothetical protein n=1 Tax=Natrinema sp. DC36 TaxID=2878680 RepID=UPI001CEFD4F3|nr:hypothetical protein [Natrinema sp. DC36]
MTDWNASLVTRDGEEIEPSTKLAGARRSTRTQPSVASEVHAAKLRQSLDEREYESEPTDDFQCPDCGRDHDDREAQADCLRRHARGRADRLQQLADDGDDVLPGVGC